MTREPTGPDDIPGLIRTADPVLPSPSVFADLAAGLADGLALLSESVGGYRKMLITQGFDKRTADQLAADMAYRMHAQMFGALSPPVIAPTKAT